MGCGRWDLGSTLDDATVHPGGGDASLVTDAGVQPWAIVQVADAAAAMSQATPPLQLPYASGSGHLIVVAVQLQGGTVTGVSDDKGCNAYLPIPTAHASNSVITPVETLDFFYAKHSCAGASTITIAVDPSGTFRAAVAWEVSGILADDPLGNVGVLNEQISTTMPMGPSIVTTTPGEFIVSVAIVQNAVSHADSGDFKNDSYANNNGWAHLINPMATKGIAIERNGNNLTPAPTAQAPWRSASPRRDGPWRS